MEILPAANVRDTNSTTNPHAFTSGCTIIGGSSKVQFGSTFLPGADVRDLVGQRGCNLAGAWNGWKVTEIGEDGIVGQCTQWA